MPLTDVRCRNAKARIKPFKLSDGGGLHLLINSEGAKYWRLAYRWHGKQRTLALGVYPAVGLSQEHRNIERLLAILERELQVFDRGDRPDYKVISAVISYFELYPEVYHHPQEDLVFAKLKIRDPAAAAKVGDLAREHQRGAERLRRVAHAVDNVLASREVLRQNFDTIVRDFIEHERRHIMMEDRDFFPAALKALEPQDWTEIASALTNPEDPLFSEAAEETFDALRACILQLEQEAEAGRH